jgi:hypothetical protein
MFQNGAFAKGEVDRTAQRDALLAAVIASDELEYRYPFHSYVVCW